MIRNLYPSDFLFLLLHNKPSLTNEAGSCIIWNEEKAARSAHAPFLRQWLAPNERRFSWIYTSGNRIYGLISAKERATGACWEIDYFLLPREEKPASYFKQEISRALLEALTIHAEKRNVRKVFFRSYSTSPLIETLQSSHFKIYLREYLFHIESRKMEIRPGKKGTNISGHAAGGDYLLRPRQAADDDALYQLVFKTQPAPVRMVESINFRDWKETREKACFGEKELIVEKDNSVQGWMGIRKGANWGHFRVIAYTVEKILEPMNLFLTSFLKNKKDIYCTVRDYQEELKKFLQDEGFEKKGEFILAYKEISITGKRPVLVSQGA